MKKEKTPEELKKEGRKLKRRVDKGVKIRGKKVIEKKKTSKSKTKTVTQEGKPTKVTKVKRVPLTRAEEAKRMKRGAAIGTAIGASFGASVGNRVRASDNRKAAAQKAAAAAYTGPWKPHPDYKPAKPKKTRPIAGNASLLGVTGGILGLIAASQKENKRVKTKTVGGVNKKAAKKVVKSKMKTMRQKRRSKK